MSNKVYPRQVAARASDFRLAAEVCFDNKLRAPCIVNYAFSIELSLKAFLKHEGICFTGDGHDLLGLFEQLPKDLCEDLRQRYLSDGLGDLDFSLEKHRHTFKEFRYSHEHFSKRPQTLKTHGVDNPNHMVNDPMRGYVERAGQEKTVEMLHQHMAELKCISALFESYFRDNF